MEIEAHLIGKTIIEISVTANDGHIMQDVCDMNGKVDTDFIEQLEYIIELLKHQNDRH